MIMNVFRTIEPISWMLGPKWETKQRSKQGLQCRIQTPPPRPHGPLPGISPLTYPFRINHCLPHVRESKKVLDSGFHAVDSGFQVLDSSLFQWNLDSGSNRWWYSGFLELYSESTRKNFPDYRIRIPLHEAICSSNCSLQVKLWNPFTPCMTKMQVTGAGIYSVYITKQHRSASGRLIIIPHSNTSAKVLFLVSIIQ